MADGAVKPLWRAWLDKDGYHVWVEHQCRLAIVKTMLPHPQWAAEVRPPPLGYLYVDPPVCCGMCGRDGQPTVDRFSLDDAESLEAWLAAP